MKIYPYVISKDYKNKYITIGYPGYKTTMTIPISEEILTHWSVIGFPIDHARGKIVNEETYDEWEISLKKEIVSSLLNLEIEDFESGFGITENDYDDKPDLNWREICDRIQDVLNDKFKE